MAVDAEGDGKGQANAEAKAQAEEEEDAKGQGKGEAKEAEGDRQKKRQHGEEGASECLPLRTFRISKGRDSGRCSMPIMPFFPCDNGM